MRKLVTVAIVAFGLCMGAAGTANAAGSMHLSEDGTGQVLLFPYYTARNNTNTMITLLNTTPSHKAVRLNFREAKSGLVVHRMNVYLPAKDVWTSALVNDKGTVLLVTPDKSCTSPKVPTSGLAFNASQSMPQTPAGLDRMLEGFIEVIEMATIKPSSATDRLIRHRAGAPDCRTPSASIDSEPPLADLDAPTGGLTGTISYVAVMKGMLASAPPVAINNFWLSGAGAPTPRAYGVTSFAPDLTSGLNTWARISAIADGQATPDVGDRRPQTYVARFSNTIDAVSALLTQFAVSMEYAYTLDHVLATTAILTMPTKSYYVHGANTGMFASPWDESAGQSCDEFQVASTDRELFAGIAVITPGAPQPTIPKMCNTANVLSLVGSVDATNFGSPLAYGIAGYQNAGNPVAAVGKEGGWMELTWVNAATGVAPIEAMRVGVDAAGKFEAVPTSVKFLGLPAIGFSLYTASYSAGNPQQNYSDGKPLTFRKVASTLP